MSQVPPPNKSDDTPHGMPAGPDPEKGRPTGEKSADSFYLIAVGLLLLMIIGSLTYLWLNERKRRRRAEQAVGIMQKQTLGQMMGPGAMRGLDSDGVEPIRRDDLPSVMMNIDGELRRVVLVGAQAGSRVGFQPGDVVIVSSEQPDTQPETMPGAEAED
ncbi:MAG: hypothetical protein ACLFVU_11505 [Phycisphaerae bacterium]